MFKTPIILLSILLILTSSIGWADEINDLLPAIICVESGGNPNALSPKGAIGLMQITPIVLKEFNEYHYKVWEIPKLADLYLPVTSDDLFFPHKNKYIGGWYLHRLKDHYLKDRYTTERLLAAYNGGITRLKKVNYDINKMPKETRNYVRKVMRIYLSVKEHAKQFQSISKNGKMTKVEEIK